MNGKTPDGAHGPKLKVQTDTAAGLQTLAEGWVCDQRLAAHGDDPP